MDTEQVKKELSEVLGRYPNLILGVVGIAYLDDKDAVMAHGFSLVRREPTDHEENLMRDNICNKVSSLAGDLVKMTYNIPPGE